MWGDRVFVLSAIKTDREATAAEGALAALIDRRLLRVEERLDVRRVELTHDVLAEVILVALAVWRYRRISARMPVAEMAP